MSLHHGDCLEVMAAMDPESVDAIVTDPPYNLVSIGQRFGKAGAAPIKDDNFGGRYTRLARGFMGKAWDGDGIAFRSETWEAAYRVARPSAYLLAFGGTRTVHRMTVAIEDAGWIIRDMLVWAYASGFPKSKASLKPAWEPIVMARKPGPRRNLAIDECRIPAEGEPVIVRATEQPADLGTLSQGPRPVGEIASASPLGRWPANVILSDKVFEPGVPGVVIAGSLTGTMTAWSSSPDSEPSPTASPASNADRRSSRGVPGVSFPASATGLVGTQLDAWGTSTDTPKPDTGCSDGTTADGGSTSGNIARSGRTPTARFQPAISSTIATATASTTGSTTSSSSPEPSTPDFTRPSHPESSERGGTREPGTPDGSSDGSATSRPNSSRAGEASADRRYTERGGTDFAPLPGERRDVDGSGYSRFFLIPKADRADREPVLAVTMPLRKPPGWSSGEQSPGTFQSQPTPPRENVHPTVKPTDLMRHLVRLVTPPGGVVLDPFLGSGTTAIAAEMEGFAWIGIEREAEYIAIAEARLNGVQKGLGLSA